MSVDISAVAVSWNTAGCLPLALDSLPAACGERTWEAIVVDNGSTDDSVAVLGARDDVRLIALDTNTGFTAAANVGARAATGRYLLFLNPDVVAGAGTAARLAEVLEARPDAWGATPWFRYPDGSPQGFWLRLPGLPSVVLAFTRWGKAVDRVLGGRIRRHRYYAHLPDPPGLVEIDGTGAAFLLVRREEFLALGGFDERYFNFFQDGEHARRERRRGRVLLGVGDVEVIHQVGVTMRTLANADREGQYLHAYRQFLAGEPWFRRWPGELSVRLDVLLPRPDRAALRERALRPLDRPT